MPSDDYCAWLVQVASGNPEPDFPEDLYRVIECGARVEENGYGSWRCAVGHEHVSFADPRRSGYETELAFAEREADRY